MKGQGKPKKLILIIGLIVVLIAALVLGGYPLFQSLTHRDVQSGQKSDGLQVNADLYAKGVDMKDVVTDQDSGIQFVTNEIIVMAGQGASYAAIESIAKDLDANIVGYIKNIGFYQFEFADKMTYSEVERVIKKIKKNDNVADAYLNTVVEVETDEAEFPNDPWAGESSLWDESKPAGSNWGMEAIDAPAAWRLLPQMTGVNIALIDSPVDSEHSDLSVADTINNASDTVADHGTHVAGIMNAAYDNKTGITGVAPNCTLYSYETVTYMSAMDYLAAITGLVVEHDVKVINISQNTSRLIGFAADRGNEKAITYLETAANTVESGLKRLIEDGNEFLLCVAAGNNNSLKYYKTVLSKYGYRDFPLFLWDQADSGDVDAKYNNFLNLIDDELVASRIIVVGSIGITNPDGAEEVRYGYSYFSNIGSRVDIVAPGEDVYSTVAAGGYGLMSGTSMSTPHVAGVAALAFSGNPDLTGEQVKTILQVSATGRYYYTDGYSGLVNAAAAAELALQTKDQSFNRVVKTDATDGLDICFVIDTTGSMSDDIQNAKDNMKALLTTVAEKSDNFRIAIIDYRDFAARTDYETDYPTKLQLDFSIDKTSISDAINNLSLGNGGDDEETVYSALMLAASMDWRPTAQKAIIILGDAAPLDPEPVTGYTLTQVLAVLYNADISIDPDASDFETVLGDAADSLIKVYSIGTQASDSAAMIFQEISDATGGDYTGIEAAAEVTDAITTAIDQMEAVQKKDVNADFGDDYANQTVEISNADGFLFALKLSEAGLAKLESMAVGDYKWSVPQTDASGEIKISEASKKAKISVDVEPRVEFPWLWIILGAVAILVIAAIVVVIVLLLRKNRRQKRLASPPVQPQFQQPLQPQTVFCSECGTANPAEAGFCGNCGNGLVQ